MNTPDRTRPWCDTCHEPIDPAQNVRNVWRHQHQSDHEATAREWNGLQEFGEQPV